MKQKKSKNWGGKRAGSGRKNLSRTINHMKRGRVNFDFPFHVNQKLAPDLPNLRTAHFHRQLVTAIKAAHKFGLRVIHYSVLKNHIHLICEARNNADLGAGMRSLFGRISRIVRRISTKPIDGSVFRGRYFLNVIRDPRHMRRTLEYVLFNKARHQKVIEHIDTFSSAAAFSSWKALLGRRLNGLIQEQIENLKPLKDPFLKLGVSPPKSWLAWNGWMEATIRRSSA
jgi:REP element-mobilizing transposase RayT